MIGVALKGLGLFAAGGVGYFGVRKLIGGGGSKVKVLRVKLGDEAQKRSERRAEAARKVLEPHTTAFVQAANRHGLSVSILKGIAMVETNGTNIDGDGGHGRGMMQIDDRPANGQKGWIDEWVRSGRPIPENIAKGAEILAGKRESLKRIVPGIEGDDLQYAMVAAYNTGEGNVKKS